MELEQTAGDSGTGTPSSGGSPTSTATLEPSSSGTTTQTGATATDLSKGPVPYDRFEEVNSKYNTLKWAESYEPSRVQQQKQFFDWLDADPEGAFQYMESYLQRAGVLKRQQQQAQGDGRPQPDIVIPETGQKFYSAEAAEKLAEWQAKQAVSPIEQRLNGLEVDRQTAAAHAEAARQLAQAETWPHYKTHEAEILREMERDQRLSLEGAYNRVVLPKLRQLERQAVLAEINQKSQASTANPGTKTATNSSNNARKSWSDLFKAEMAKRG